MGNIGPGELLIIGLIALLLFGAGRIADIGKGLGQGIANFKKGLRESDEEDKAEKKVSSKEKDSGDEAKDTDEKKAKLKEA
ncbi:MAG TPA: twin-arginine translocase TatA/TatE family subunit [Polyangiaceae bacterium]|nr:twin-arginine translocase TatA/TatE family subunit [Polyangiaceae bacterium]